LLTWEKGHRTGREGSGDLRGSSKTPTLEICLPTNRVVWYGSGGGRGRVREKKRKGHKKKESRRSQSHGKKLAFLEISRARQGPTRRGDACRITRKKWREGRGENKKKKTAQQEGGPTIRKNWDFTGTIRIYEGYRLKLPLNQE